MIKGMVQRGQGRGAALGYPTANIPLEDMSVSGVYAARVHVDGKEYDAAVFADPARKILEAHILDFSSDLYGKEIEIELLDRIRESKSFENDEDLKKAIAEDIEAVRQRVK